MSSRHFATEEPSSHSWSGTKAIYIELEPTDHPLAVEPRTGMTSARLQEIGEWFEHTGLHPRWAEKALYGGAS